ncbi:MAG: hypothetical protein K5978_01710 [Campylobacter sp.]|nr:hypothetical protein [Campylobacter sp.]
MTDVIFMAPGSGNGERANGDGPLENLILSSNGKECIVIYVVIEPDFTHTPPHIEIHKGNDQDDPFCQRVYKEPAVASALVAKFSYTSKVTSVNDLNQKITTITPNDVSGGGENGSGFGSILLNGL